MQQTWVWHKLPWRRSPLTPPQSHQNLDWTGETDSWRDQTEPCSQDSEERSPDPNLPVSVQESSTESWVSGSLLQGWEAGGTECSSASMGPLEGDRHYLHYLHHSLAPGQTTGREHSPNPSTENWIKDLLRMAPSQSDQDSFPLSPPSQSLPSGTFPEPLILIHQRADNMKTTITEN